MFVIHASVFNSNMKRRWWYKWAVIQWRSIRRSRQKHSIRLLCLSKSPCERCIMRQRQHCAWPTKSMSLCLHCSFTTTFCEPKPNFISADSGITTKRIVSVYSRKNLLNEICKYTKKKSTEEYSIDEKIRGIGWFSLLCGKVFGRRLEIIIAILCDDSIWMTISQFFASNASNCENIATFDHHHGIDKLFLGSKSNQNDM